MTLLTQMTSNKHGVVTAITAGGKEITLEGCAQVDAVFGLNKNDNAKKAMAELQTKAKYNDSKFYWIIDTKISEDKQTFAIPYACFIK